MPKIVDHEQYRKELLSKSFHLFAQKGYGAITMRQLAEGLGVSTGTLYHYFPSKQVIFEQMMLERIDSSMRTFASDVALRTRIVDKMTVVFQFFQREEKDATEELILYIEYYKHQQREGQTENLIEAFYKRLKPEAICLLGTDDEQVIQFVFSIIDGLLIAHIYGCTIDWNAQAQLVGTMLETHIQSNHL